MLRLNRTSFSAVIILVGLMILPACATRRYVRDQVGILEPQVTEVAGAVRENAERIDAVDARAQQGISDAEAANQRATEAQQAADAADQRAGQAQESAQNANQAVEQAVQQFTGRFDTVETRIASIDNYTAGPPQAVTFQLNSSTLTNEAMSTLDGIASQLANLPGGYMVEIKGFTDTTGSESYNVALSHRRAESVQRYLVSKDVALSRISMIGLGEENPVSDNATAAGRAENRRVEVRVLRAPTAGATN